MIFQFEHVTTFWDPALGKWKPKPVDLVSLKRVFAKWQDALHDSGWNSLFWSNHDLPRAVSRYGSEAADRVASAKMLATVLHLMQGTPFIFQGEEIGMTNAGFTDIGQYRDLETLNFFKIQTALGVSTADFLTGARASSRDNARTPMQWENSANAGFSSGTPWIAVNANCREINVAADSNDPHGVSQRYRQLIELRKKMAIIRRGDFHLLYPEHPQVFAYLRRYAGSSLAVIANFTGTPTTMDIPVAHPLVGHDLLSGAQRRLSGRLDLAPYETIVIHGEDRDVS
jgi:oligo-1,6-glucosidase